MRLFIGILLLLALPGTFWAFWEICNAVLSVGDLLKPMLAGFAVGLLVCRQLSRIFILRVLNHEATHAIMALFFMRRVTRFVVARQGGYIQYTGGAGGAFGNHMIGLAPYFFPFIALCMALVRPVLQPPWFPYWDILTGMVFACHAWSVVDNILHSWHKKSFNSIDTGIPVRSDIGRRGYVFSGLMIATFNLFFCGLVFSLVTGGYPGAASFFYTILVRNVDLFSPIFIHYFPLK